MNLPQSVRKIKYKTYLWFFHKMPIKNNKILLWTNNFHAYGDSPKYIAEYMLHHFPNKYDLVWVFENDVVVPADMPSEIRVVRFFSTEYLKEISTAKMVICNARIPSYCFFDKREGQIYIQTWHSSLRLKMIEGDAPSLPESYVVTAKLDSKKIDLLLSGCMFSTEVFQRAFWYDGEIMQKGTPRCDLFFNNQQEIRKKVFQYYKLPYNTKLALYAPTFRDNKEAQTHGFDFECVAEILREKTNEDWAIGCRYHPNIKAANVPNGSIDMTSYPDMQELIAAADTLITDYSSCMFDMAISGKPCILYIPDIEEYTAKERALYFKLTDLPFPVTLSMDELCLTISNFDCNTYKAKVQAFLDAVGNYENGHASESVAKYIEEKCGVR